MSDEQFKEVEGRRQALESLFTNDEGAWTDIFNRHIEYLIHHPNSATTFFNLGFAFAQHNQPGNAEVAFLKALEISPGMVEALVNLGGLAFGRQDWDKSIRYNLQAITVRPDMIEPKTNLGFAHLMKGKFEDALKMFEEVAKDAPKFGRGFYGLAVAHYRLDNFESARKYLDRALELGVKAEPEFVNKVRAAKP